jgi:hypothetical protein
VEEVAIVMSLFMVAHGVIQVPQYAMKSMLGVFVDIIKVVLTEL